MTVTFQIDKAEEVLWIEKLLKMIPSTSIHIEVESSLSKVKPLGLAQKLHGIIDLPKDFDYKKTLGDALSEKYGL
jgi:hypothetical protein